MSRRPSLSAVPNAPRSGLDLEELRRTADASDSPGRHAALSVDPTEPAGSARERLLGAQAAKNRLLEAIDRKQAEVARVEAAVAKHTSATSELAHLEADAQERVSRWLLAGAQGPPPTLSGEDRRRLDAIRATVSEMSIAVAVVQRELPRLHDELGQLLRAAPSLDAEIRRLAVELVVLEGLPLVEQLDSELSRVRATRTKLIGLRELLIRNHLNSTSSFAKVDDAVTMNEPEIAGALIELEVDHLSARVKHLEESAS